MELVLEGHASVRNAHFFGILRHDNYHTGVRVTLRDVAFTCASGRAFADGEVQVTLIASIPIRERGFSWHELGKLRYVARLVDLLERTCHLCELCFLISLEHLELVIHAVHKRLFLIVKSFPSIICLLVFSGHHLVLGFVSLEHVMSLITLESQSRDVILQVSNRFFSLLLVEIGLVVSLYLLEESFSADTSLERVNIYAHADGKSR